MPGLVPGIHVLGCRGKTWMAGTSPAMTEDEGCCIAAALGPGLQARPRCSNKPDRCPISEVRPRSRSHRSELRKYKGHRKPQFSSAAYRFELPERTFGIGAGSSNRRH